MKRLAVIVTLIALLAASTAFAEVKDFGKFTLDVPTGWTSAQEGPTATVTKDDKTAALTITIMPSEGASAKDLATAFTEEFKKSFKTVGTPEADADGDYSWDMKNENGVNTKAMLHVEGGDCMLVTMTGLETAGEEIGNILGTLKDK